MTGSSHIVAAVWTSRCLLVVLAGGLIVLWARPEFGFVAQRGTMIEGPHVHVFFLGLVGLSLLGFCYTFGMSARRFRVAAATVLAVSIALWVSLSLMVAGIVQSWLWIVLTVIWLAVPLTLAVILFGPCANSTYHRRCWIACLLTVVLALGVLAASSRQVRILIHKIPLAACNSWVAQNRHGLNAFRFDFMLWSLAGGSPHDLDETMMAGRDALLRLGYFEQMDFQLHGARVHDVLQLADKTRFKDSLWRMKPHLDRSGFILCAYSGDMPLWEAVVAKADRQKAQHSAAPNGGPAAPSDSSDVSGGGRHR